MRGETLLDVRVGQYEQRVDDNRILDTHPEAANAWIARRGSAHG